MKKNQKKTSLILPLAIFGVAIILIVFSLMTSKSRLNSRDAEVQEQVSLEETPVIQNTEDLNDVDSELNNIDLSEFDKQLNELDIDASTF